MPCLAVLCSLLFLASGQAHPRVVDESVVHCVLEVGFQPSSTLLAAPGPTIGTDQKNFVVATAGAGIATIQASDASLERTKPRVQSRPIYKAALALLVMGLVLISLDCVVRESENKKVISGNRQRQTIDGL